MKKPDTVEIKKRVLSLSEGDDTKALRRIVIERDNDPMNPRKEWDNVFTIYSDCKYLASDKDAENPVVDYGSKPSEAKFKEGVFALPIYAYVHSGMKVSLKPFNDPWDSGVAGFIYVDKAKFREEYGLKRFSARKAYDVAEGEIKTLDQYINGEVFGYVEQTRDTPDDEWEDGDSCWGYFGDDYIGGMVADAGGYEQGTIVCEGENVSVSTEVTIKVLKEIYERVNTKKSA